jgi:glycosyltransferase involved in cell wall biosynthesis
MDTGGEPLVTVVVLSYNHGRFLRDCLDSILNQEGGHSFEVVLVDDASTDDSAAVARTYDDPRIRFVRHPVNAGHAATVADGLRCARGRYVARIDGDDRYRPDYLSEVLAVFRAFPSVGLVYGDNAEINDAGEITAPRNDRVHGGRDFRGNELLPLLEHNFICAPTVIARREGWLEALPVPPGLAFHDWYFTLMMARRYEFYYRHRVLADYRVHAGNLHRQIVRDRSDEASTFWLLERIFRERESDPTLEARKRRARRRVYGAQYLTLARKYLALRMDGDARRCYLLAVRYRPRYLARPDVARQLAGTLMGRRPYELTKSLARAALRRGRAPGGRRPAGGHTS